MSWSRRLTLLGLLMTAGCGFRPLYAPPAEDAPAEEKAVVQDLASVYVEPIADRRGQELRNRLTALLTPTGEQATERYRLNVTLTETQQSLAVRQTGFATRTNLRIDAVYRLIDTTTGQPVLGGSASAASSYDLLDSDFSTLAAINDARSRVAQQLAGDLRNRLAVFFTAQPAVPTTTP